MMKSSLLGVACVLAYCLPLRSTTHRLYYDGSSIWVASDGMRSVRSDSNPRLGRVKVPACKVVEVNDRVLTLSGMTTNTYVAANKDGTYKVVTDHAFHPIAAKILQQQRNPNDAFEHLITASSAHLKTMMSLHQEDSANKDLRDYKLGGTMVAFVDGSPRIWSYLIEVVDWGKGPGKPQILDRSRLFEPYEVLALGEVSPKSMSFPIPYKDYRGGSIKLLLNQLEIQSKLTPDSVGRPFTVVKLKQDGSEFAIGGSVCHDEWQAVHR